MVETLNYDEDEAKEEVSPSLHHNRMRTEEAVECVPIRNGRRYGLNPQNENNNVMMKIDYDTSYRIRNLPLTFVYNQSNKKLIEQRQLHVSINDVTTIEEGTMEVPLSASSDLQVIDNNDPPASTKEDRELVRGQQPKPSAGSSSNRINLNTKFFSIDCREDGNKKVSILYKTQTKLGIYFQSFL